MLESSPPTLSTPASAEDRRQPKDQPHIVLFIEETGGDWHARRLAHAIKDLGGRVTTTTLKDCTFDTETPSGLSIPGFDGHLPDGAFVRSVSTGTLEQITMRLGVLHALRESGVRVWNDARVIERCVDKSTTTFLLQRAKLPVPKTLTTEREKTAAAFCENNLPLVSKPLFGSQGNGMRRLKTPQDLPQPADLGNVYYLQEYLRCNAKTQFEDWRILVSAGRVIASMARQGNHWVTNVHQGGRPAETDHNPEMQAMALAAVKAVGADYAGVDLIRAPDGRLLILEINSNPAWKGAQSITETDIASQLAQDFMNAILNVRTP